MTMTYEEFHIEQLTRLVYHLIRFGFPLPISENDCPLCQRYLPWHYENCPYPDYKELIDEIMKKNLEEEIDVPRPPF